MDISVGSPHGPETRVGNQESCKCSEEQKQSQPHAAPTQSAVRFKVRSAKERQQLFTKASSFNCETFENASRSIKEYREEMPGIHTISSPSPNADMIDTRRPRVLNPLSLSKTAEMPTSSETRSITPKKQDSVETPTTQVRGRTEWRQVYMSNRSKSLDWKGSKSEGGQDKQKDVIINTEESRRYRGSFGNDRPLMSSISLHIKPFKETGQRKLENNELYSSLVSETSPHFTMALAQSFPSTLKANQSQSKTEEKKSLWHSGHSGTKPDQAKQHLRSASKIYEVTGNHAHPNVLEDNSETSSRVSHQLTIPSPLLSHSKPSSDSPDRYSSFSSLNKAKTVSYSSERCGTCPKTAFKEEQMNFTTLPPNSLLPNSKEKLVTVPAWSKQKPVSQDSISLVTTKSISEERRMSGNTIGLGTRSLGRASNRYFTDILSSGLNNTNVSIQKNTREEIEKQVEIMPSNSKQTKGMETTPDKKKHGLQEGLIPRTKLTSSQSMTADNEKHHQKHGTGLEFGSSGNPSKKSEGLLEKAKEPSWDSVRNKIHKFEALALQSQSSSWIQHPRRACSVTEKPKVVASLNKTYSDRSLSKRWGDWNRECLKEDLFSKTEVCDEAEAVCKPDLNRPVQIAPQDKEGSPVKTHTTGSKSQEPGDVQTKKLLNEFPSNQMNEAPFTVMNKHVDEPDFCKGQNLKSNQKLKKVDLMDEKVKNVTVSHNSPKSSGSSNVSVHSDVKDFSAKPANIISQSTKEKAFLTSERIPGLTNSDLSTPVKSTLLTGNSAHSKLLNDSVVVSPIQLFSPADDLTNSLKDKKVVEKVTRWIMEKGIDDAGEDDEDDEGDDDEGTERGYDSDSGESSVTITSNMSNRSFSMSLVELRSLGGLDLPPSDGSGSKDDENWMSTRTVSLSSDVSALSSVTLLGMDELECLLNDVKGLEDDALENYEDVHVVVLHKDVGSGLGFTVAGGVDQNKPATVHKVLRNGVAAKEGSIHEGDQVLSINGTALHNSTHKEALSTMRKSRGRAMAVVVIRRGYINETCYSVKDCPQFGASNPGSTVRVTLNKSSSDLGFSLEGGVGSAFGDKPLTVQRLFQGGPVGKVFPGDELLEVEGQRLEGLRRLEVWHLIKRLPPGPVEVLLQRSHH